MKIKKKVKKQEKKKRNNMKIKYFHDFQSVAAKVS